MRQSDIKDGIPTEVKVATEVRLLKGGRVGGDVGHARIILEGLDTAGNAQEGIGEETVVDCGDISIAGFWIREPTGGSRMGDNGPHPKREGGVLWYWDS